MARNYPYGYKRRTSRTRRKSSSGFNFNIGLFEIMVIIFVFNSIRGCNVEVDVVDEPVVGVDIVQELVIEEEPATMEEDFDSYFGGGYE